MTVSELEGAEPDPRGAGSTLVSSLCLAFPLGLTLGLAPLETTSYLRGGMLAKEFLATPTTAALSPQRAAGA